MEISHVVDVFLDTSSCHVRRLDIPPSLRRSLLVLQPLSGLSKSRPSVPPTSP